MAVTKADFSQLKVLVIDDSQYVRRLVSELLLSFGFHKVHLVESAEEAFSFIAHTVPDLIICDWQMYPTDGLAILRKLRLELSNRYPRIPFIMLTGHNGNEDVATAIGEGADSYIVKPFSAGTLMTHLLKVIVDDQGRRPGQVAWAV